MATLKVLDGKMQMISGEGKLLYPQTQIFVEELKKYSSASSQYTVISIIGPQSSGKSYLLNTLFGTKFDVLNAKGRRKQTTKGIWIAKCRDPCMIIMDVEGSDGRERGEDDTLFERRSAMFCLTISDVLLLNMWFNDIGRVNAASYGLLKLIFEERVKIEAPKITTVIILVRDYNYETPTDITKEDLESSMNELWHKVHGTTKWKMSDYIKVIVKDFPNKSEKQEFAQKSEDLAKYLCTFPASGSLEQNHYASSFAYSSQRIWNLICNNKRLTAADHKLAMSAYVCNEIKKEILCSLDKETEYWPLLSGTYKSVKGFNTELLLFLKRILTRYEEETTAFDGHIRKEVRGKLEEKTLKRFKQTFEDKIVSLSNQTLSSAKSKVSDQILKLSVLDSSSLIGVIGPYLAEFDDNSSSKEVHRYFQEVLGQHRKELEDGLIRIVEKKARKIKIVVRTLGSTTALVKLMIGTGWAFTGDLVGASMCVANAVSSLIDIIYAFRSTRYNIGRSSSTGGHIKEASGSEELVAVDASGIGGDIVNGVNSLVHILTSGSTSNIGGASSSGVHTKEASRSGDDIVNAAGSLVDILQTFGSTSNIGGASSIGGHIKEASGSGDDTVDRVNTGSDTDEVTI